MTDAAEWWENLGPETQDWLAVHVRDRIPVDVADQIEAAGGCLFDAVWAAGDRECDQTRMRFVLPADRHWIEILTEFE